MYTWFGIPYELESPPPIYTVDRTRPPIFPPGRHFYSCGYGELETLESIRANKLWREYITEYGKKDTLGEETRPGEYK